MEFVQRMRRISCCYELVVLPKTGWWLMSGLIDFSLTRFGDVMLISCLLVGWLLGMRSKAGLTRFGRWSGWLFCRLRCKKSLMAVGHELFVHINLPLHDVLRSKCLVWSIDEYGAVSEKTQITPASEICKLWNAWLFWISEKKVFVLHPVVFCVFDKVVIH